MRLSIGSGPDTRRLQQLGYVTVDINPQVKPDIVAEVPPLPDEVKAQQWAWIEMVHVIEHFYLWDARQILWECHEVLEDGGTLMMEAPDIEVAAQYLLGLKDKHPERMNDAHFYDMVAFYGDPAHKSPAYGHRWGWTPMTLSRACLDVGFSSVKALAAQYHWPWRDFRVEAVK